MFTHLEDFLHPVTSRSQPNSFIFSVQQFIILVFKYFKDCYSDILRDIKQLLSVSVTYPYLVSLPHLSLIILFSPDVAEHVVVL